MAKKTHIKVRLVPEEKPDSPFFYYVKKPAGGEKAKVKLKAKKYNPATRKHEIFVEKKIATTQQIKYLFFKIPSFKIYVSTYHILPNSISYFRIYFISNRFFFNIF